MEGTLSMDGTIDAPEARITVGAPPRDPQTRAIVREIARGNHTDCRGCGQGIRFRTKLHHQTVICNVYDDGRWDRVEHWHLECYRDAGEPHGHPDATELRRPVRPARAHVQG
jgi:hypothetical protein